MSEAHVVYGLLTLAAVVSGGEGFRGSACSDNRTDPVSRRGGPRVRGGGRHRHSPCPAIARGGPGALGTGTRLRAWLCLGRAATGRDRGDRGPCRLPAPAGRRRRVRADPDGA